MSPAAAYSSQEDTRSAVQAQEQDPAFVVVPSYPAPRPKSTLSTSTSSKRVSSTTGNSFLSPAIQREARTSTESSASSSVPTEEAAHQAASSLIGSAFKDTLSSQDLAGQLAKPAALSPSATGAAPQLELQHLGPQQGQGSSVQRVAPISPSRSQITATSGSASGSASWYPPYVVSTSRQQPLDPFLPKSPVSAAHAPASASGTDTAAMPAPTAANGNGATGTGTGPSRKSILASMGPSTIGSSGGGGGAGSDIRSITGGRYVSNTDAILSQQRGESGAVDAKSVRSAHSRRTSVGSAKYVNGSANGVAAGDNSYKTYTNGYSNGIESDRASTKSGAAGNRMSRLLRRATSREDGLNGTSTNGSDAKVADDSRSVKSFGRKRMSLKVPKLGNKDKDGDPVSTKSATSRRNSVASTASRLRGSNSPTSPPANGSYSPVGEEQVPAPQQPVKINGAGTYERHYDSPAGQQAAYAHASAAQVVQTAASNYGAGVPANAGGAGAPQVPPLPKQYQRPMRSPERPPSSGSANGLVGTANGSNGRAVPQQQQALQRQPEQQREQEPSQDQGYFGRAAGALAGGAAAVVGVAGAAASAVLPSSVTSNAASSVMDESDDEDVFHDAPAASSEAAAAELHQRRHDHPPSQRELEVQRLRAEEEAHDGAQGKPAFRHRGQSAPPHAIPPSHHVTEDDETTTFAESTGYRATGGLVANNNRRAPSITSTARAPSISAASSTTADGGAVKQMKKETPEYVRDKAAAVAKLKFEDVKQDEADMKRDIEAARGALHLFLNSKMLEAEDIVKRYADKKLYYALGAALIAVIKGFMTFEPEDLATAISFCKDAIHIAQLLRKPTNTVANFGRFVRGTGQSPTAMAGMTLVQRHAELIYAEAVLLKAVMGILYSGDFFGFIAEALNMRNAYGIYRSLAKYVEWADEQASKKRRGAIDESIDEDFRSGVYLGSGMISMILGLLPGKVLKVMEVFGYTGDCVEALKILAKAGEWSPNPKHTKPGMPMEEEGIRRQICDMGMLLYHLVISTFMPVNGVDISMADKILHYNLERYPQGIFFLYFSGRLYSSQALAERAVKQFIKARDVQREYVQLQHICYWDMTLCHMALCQWKEAHDCFDVLLHDSNWSKAVYNYGKGANLYQAGAASAKEAAKLISKTPELMQRIAGKSIPLEKFCARKAKKFQEQGRLLLPAMEFSYTYHCLSNAPRYVLADEHLVLISEHMREIHAAESDPSSYYSGEDEFWDDYCLAHFLRAVTLKYIAHPEPHSKCRPRESPIPVEEAEEQAEMSLKKVIANGTKITTDHYLMYFAHYELGRLYAAMGRKQAAKDEFNLILSGKNLGDKNRKGKYSMQNMCLLRSNGALNALEGKI